MLELLSVEFGVTGPSERNEAAKSGSEASEVMAGVFVELALGEGCTVGPGPEAAGGWLGERWEGGAVGGMREGYLRAVGAAARVALEVVEPIV